jgi:preprotein translocase subunit SecD
VAASAGRRRALNALAAQLPAGVSPGSGQVLVVPEGTRVVQAQTSAATEPKSFSDPSAQFFILRDRVALTGSDITHPRASTDSGGAPSVAFGFTGAGRAAFQQATRAIARRGANVSLGGQILNQHFAVVLDDHLVTVPSISYQQYPDGIIGDGADITGGLTAQAAKDLATQLRSGALPLALRVVS